MAEKWLSEKEMKHITPKVVKGMPLYMKAEKHFGMQKGHDADSQFIAAELKTEDGREFGIMLHMMFMNPQSGSDTAYPLGMSIISMTDLTNGTYCAQESGFPMGQFTQKEGEEMDVSTPVSYMRGNQEHIDMGADLPENKGYIELSLDEKGPVLYNCATGLFPIFPDEGESGQFSLPYLEGAGTLKEGEKVTKITGRAWLDREWVDACPDFYNRDIRWYWMNLQLDNGYRISLWDMVQHNKEEHAWATIVSPTGAHTVVDMEPMDKYEGAYFVGKTGQKYPTKYHVSLPSINSYFDVQVRGPLEQEIISPMGEDKFEAMCEFTGKFLGEDVKGTNYVELVGSFR